MPFYHDEADAMVKLNQGLYYRDSHFEEDIVEHDYNFGESHDKIKGWDDEDQHRLCREVMNWLGF